MLTPSRMFYTATISVGELGVLFSLSVYVVSLVLRWFFYGGCSRRFGDCSSPCME